MKIEELLPESNLAVINPNAPMPDSTKAKKISGHPLPVPNIHDLYVYKLEDAGFLYYYVKDKYNSVVAFAKIGVCGFPFAQPKNVKCNILGNGIMSILFSFLVREEGLKLLSDDLMTKDGIKLWQNLHKKGYSLRVSIVDFYDETQYDIDKVKQGLCKTSDNKIVKLPEDDDEPVAPSQLEIKKNPDKYQRFYYIAESFKSICEKTKILEDSAIKKQNNKIPFLPFTWTGDYYEFGEGDL